MTRDTLVVGTLPRVTPERFREVLEANRSPAAPEAEACYWAVARLAVDPLFALAVFRHESSYGRSGISLVYQTKNPGNTRSSRTGVGEVISTERGPFVRYPSWEEGFRDLAFRLVDQEFVYAQRGLRTVAEVIPTWAPASDGNAPEAYIQSVVRTMADFQQDTIGVPFRVALIPKGNPNRPGYPMRPQWVTVHETGNPRPKADAEAHRAFTHAGGGAENVSFHFVVDDHEVVQLLPLTENGWHAGDGPNGPGNRTSIAIETCVNQDGDWERTKANLTKLLAALCRSYGWGTDRIVQHHRWSGKDCPSRLRAEGSWDRVLAEVGRLLGAAPGPARTFPETGKSIQFGFRAFWERLEREGLALLVLGYPVTDELPGIPLDGKPRTVQVFERGVLVWEPEHPAPWDVHLATIEQVVQVLKHIGRL